LRDTHGHDVGQRLEERDVGQAHEDETEPEDDQAGRAAPSQAADLPGRGGAAQVVAQGEPGGGQAEERDEARVQVDLAADRVRVFGVARREDRGRRQSE